VKNEKRLTVLVGKCQGKRQLGRIQHRYEENTKVNVREIRCEGVEWIQLAQYSTGWVTIQEPYHRVNSVS
jgi:hypothetical protein